MARYRFVGIIMAGGTLYVLDAAMPGGFVQGAGNLQYGQTMAFTTLMLFQMFNVFNARSDDRSALPHMFTNGWLWSAVAASIGLHVLVVYLTPLQHAFGTVALSLADWCQCVAVASTVLWFRELGKLIQRVRSRLACSET